MATRTITSPGVEIREKDLSLIAPQTVGTSVFVTGFAKQGPADEVIKITTRDELEAIYGTPTTSAERYFYHSIRELLNSPSNVYASRLPYGPSTGTGFGSKYSALAYPAASYSLSSYSINLDTTNSVNLSGSQFRLVLSDNLSYTFGFSAAGVFDNQFTNNAYVQLTGPGPYTASTLLNAISTAVNTLDTSATFLSTGSTLTIVPSLPITNGNFSFNLSGSNTGTGNTSNYYSYNIAGGTYLLGKPTHLELTEEQYYSFIDGTVQWASAGSDNTTFNSINSLSSAAVVVLNKSRLAQNDQYEGYYVGLTDNLFINPGSDYKHVRGIQTINTSNPYTKNFVSIPSSTLEFNLTSIFNYGGDNSISQALENISDYDISNRTEDDLLGIGVFKLRKSIYATEAFKLDYVYTDRLLGSIDYHRQITNDKGGPLNNYFIGNVGDVSRNVKVIVNDYISNRNVGTAIGNDGITKKRIRVLTNELLTNNNSEASGIPTSFLQSISSNLGLGDQLFPLGAYSGQRIDSKELGSIPEKLDRALDAIRNEDLYDVDVVIEAGLGTIWAASRASGTNYYDEYNYNSGLSTKIDALRSTTSINADGESIRNDYMTIFNKFNNFSSPLYIGGGRGDCLFIADPLRHIYITGDNTKVSKKSTYVFQRDTYWATRHQFENANTSYATVYANWAQVFDSNLGKQVWVPFSPFAASVMARTDAVNFPWFAPAGFETGLIQSALDIASTPNQKQRDELYKINLNPVTFFPAQGQVIFGQKTLSKKPSAFDRINVRRLFLSLERPVRKAAQFFVFQPNTTFTRTRLVNTITPIFERAKNNQGLYDYLIVCDERNNTAEVIDSNELVVDIYIKPVRASEFILVNFIATRTDANFQELIAG